MMSRTLRRLSSFVVVFIVLLAIVPALRAQVDSVAEFESTSVPVSTRYPSGSEVDTTYLYEDFTVFTLRSKVAGNPLPFEGYDPCCSDVQWGRAAAVGGVLTALVTGIHIYQQNAWWKDQRTSFHFVNDPEYALNVDKAGHVLGGAFGSFLGQKSLEWSGFSRDASVWGGFAMGALFELYVEFEDGFARDWGFSPGDAIADVAGALWPVAQAYVPYAEHVQPKFSYWPSKALRDGTHKGNAIDDYEGQTYWLGLHVEGLLPSSLKPYWPDWLGIAVGVSIRDMEQWDNRTRNIILALDYDMTKLPGDGWFLHALKQALNYIHFPAPAIRISPNYVAYGFYF